MNMCIHLFLCQIGGWEGTVYIFFPDHGLNRTNKKKVARLILINVTLEGGGRRRWGEGIFMFGIVCL